MCHQNSHVMGGAGGGWAVAAGVGADGGMVHAETLDHVLGGGAVFF